MTTPITPVASGHLAKHLESGLAIQKVCIERIEGRFRIILYPKNRSAPIVVALARGGGVKWWHDCDKCLAWIEHHLPEIKEIPVLLIV